jgi:hypothetical protein
MRSRLSESFGVSVGRVLLLALFAASIAGCASTQTGSLSAPPNNASLLEKTAALLRARTSTGGLSDSEADAVVARAIVEHEMRDP